jgi:hypothetical protein
MSIIDSIIDMLASLLISLGIVKSTSPGQPVKQGEAGTTVNTGSTTGTAQGKPNSGAGPAVGAFNAEYDMYKIVVEKNGIDPGQVSKLGITDEGRTLLVVLADGSERRLPIQPIVSKTYVIKVPLEKKGQIMKPVDVLDWGGFSNAGYGKPEWGATAADYAPDGTFYDSLAMYTSYTWGKPEDPLGLNGWATARYKDFNFKYEYIGSITIAPPKPVVAPTPGSTLSPEKKRTLDVYSFESLRQVNGGVGSWTDAERAYAKYLLETKYVTQWSEANRNTGTTFGSSVTQPGSQENLDFWATHKMVYDANGNYVCVPK